MASARPHTVFRRGFLACAVWLLVGSRSAWPAGVPYREDFDGYDNNANPSVVPAGFAESSGWSVKDDGLGNDYEHSIEVTNDSGFGTKISNYAATIVLTNVVGTSFVMSAQMTIDAATASDPNNGIAGGLLCLWDGTYLDGIYANGYKGVVDLVGAAAGTLSLVKSGTPLASTVFPSPLASGTPYTISLHGTHATPATLNLALTMSDGVSTASVSYVDSSPLTGQRFGFENVLTTRPGTAAYDNVDYDDLSVLAGVSPPLSPSSFSFIQVNGEDVVLGITNLTVDTTAEIVRTPSLAAPQWTTDAVFRAHTVATNWSGSAVSSPSFFRVRSSR